MLMMVLLLPAGVLGGYGGDPDGVNGSWEKASTGVSLPICVRVALFSESRSSHLDYTLVIVPIVPVHVHM